MAIIYTSLNNGDFVKQGNVAVNSRNKQKDVVKAGALTGAIGDPNLRPLPNLGETDNGYLSFGHQAKSDYFIVEALDANNVVMIELSTGQSDGFETVLNAYDAFALMAQGQGTINNGAVGEVVQVPVGSIVKVFVSTNGAGGLNMLVSVTDAQNVTVVPVPVAVIPTVPA